MNEAVFLVVALNFLFIGALPRVFFRKGGLNVTWWLTAAPLYVSILLVAGAFFEVLPSVTDYHFYQDEASELAAAALSVASTALIALTVGTHRAPVSLWHQRESTPERLVTYGAYRLIRHPFYSAFLLALLAAFLFSPQPGTLFTLAYGLAALSFTAAKEERQLGSASAFGEEYRAFVQRTGRFWPRLWPVRPATKEPKVHA